MKKSGYLMTCVRCKYTEFIDSESTSRRNRYNGWHDIDYCDSEDEVMICPACAKIFETMRNIFISSFDKGVLCYTDEGDPVIFDVAMLKEETEVRKKIKKDREERISEAFKDKYIPVSGASSMEIIEVTNLRDGKIFKAVELTDADDIESVDKKEDEE